MVSSNFLSYLNPCKTDFSKVILTVDLGGLMIVPPILLVIKFHVGIRVTGNKSGVLSFVYKVQALRTES